MLNEQEIDNLREGGKKLVTILQAIKEATKPGVNLKTLEEIAEREAALTGGILSFKGYRGYPAPVCLSVNEEIVHCIPRDRVLNAGDIVSVDAGLYYKGVHTDMAVTWPVGQVSPEVKRLLQGTYAALLSGTEAIRPDNHVNDISSAIEKVLRGKGLTIFKQFVGHGIGRQLHEDPMIPNFATKVPGLKLQPGIALALEPIAGLGGEAVDQDGNQWDTRAADGKPVAHFEHTVLVTDSGFEVITPLETLIGGQKY